MIKDMAKRLGMYEVLRDAKRRTLNAFSAHGLSQWTELVPREEYAACVMRGVERLKSRNHDFGDYLEFGVSRGTSMAMAARVLSDAGLGAVRLIGFDSFEGLPIEAEEQGWSKGDFASSQPATTRYLSANGVDLERVRLVKGWFRDTCNASTIANLQLKQASIVMLDCDIHSATREALDFAGDLMGRETYVMFDDWGWREAKGEIGQREAWDQFLAERPGQFQVEPMPAYHEHARVFFVTRA